MAQPRLAIRSCFITTTVVSELRLGAVMAYEVFRDLEFPAVSYRLCAGRR